MNSLLILGIIVSIAVFIMLGINLYMMMQGRKKAGEPDDKYLVLHQRFDSLSQAVSGQLEQNRQASERATLTVSQQVQSFTQNMTQIQEGMKQMHESVKSVSSFQDIFKSPKLRGNWGEASLDAALNQYFSRDRYTLQHYFKSGEAVDAVLNLPNGLILPIDSKFNWENFEKMVNADPLSPSGSSEARNDKDFYRKTFLSDVKKKIDEIATKYILPSENTTDFALMYIPAETVYYEIINNIKDADIPQYAIKKKVILVSPNTFFLSISSVQHWFKDVEFSKQTKDIIKRLERISADGGKLADDFRKLGNHISNVKSSYDESEKRLGLMVDRVKNIIEIGEKEENPQIEEKTDLLQP